MLWLRRGVLAQLPSSRFASPVPHLHRLLSAAAPAISPSTGFAVEEYLVETCGLTRAQALKASAKISHLKFPSNPDAVLTFLAGPGLSGADVAALVAKDPQFLCASVEGTLAPVVVGLAGLGLSRSDIARLASLAVHKFRQEAMVSKVQYHLRLFGSSDNFLRVMKFCNVLSYNLERVVKPNLALLQGCGLGDRDIVKLCISTPRLLTASTKRVQAIVACAQNIGVPRGSGMFRHALHAVVFLSEDEIAARVEHLKNTFRWTDVEVGMAVSKFPPALSRSKESLQRRSEFLISEVGLEPTYIAQRPVILSYSLEGRLRPRHYVMKFLQENGLLKHDRSYYAAVVVSDSDFIKKYICPYLEVVLHLAEDYDAACKGEVPTNFRFT